MSSVRAGFLVGVLLGFVTTVLVVGVVAFMVTRQLSARASPSASLPPLTLPSPDRPLPVHGEADYAWSLLNAEGAEVPFADFEGEAVFLHLWATWCTPCIDELPALSELYASIDRGAVRVLLVSDESGDIATSFLREHGYQLPSYRVEEPLPGVFDTPGIPATFVIGPDGVIYARRVGPADWNTDETRAFLERVAAIGGAEE